MISIHDMTRLPRQDEHAPRLLPALERPGLHRLSLAAVLRAVRVDSLVEPERYLEEVVVTFGGE